MYKLFIFSLVSLYANFSFGAVCDTVIVGNGTRYEGQYPCGEGVLYSDSLGIFIGHFENGVPNGVCTHYKKNGHRYYGEFEDGKYSGYGKYFSGSGTVCIGDFENGLPNGIDTLFFRRQSIYIGACKNGQLHGQGVYYKNTPASRRYFYQEGQFADGKLNNGYRSHFNRTNYIVNGKSMPCSDFIYYSQKELQSKYEPLRALRPKRFPGATLTAEQRLFLESKGAADTVIVGNETRYEGQYPSGEGVLYSDSLGIYIGHFERGIPNGVCTHYKKNGHRYYGEFKDGEYSGYGRHFSNSGTIRMGDFKNGEANGIDTIYYKPRSIYVGECKDGVPYGKGISYSCRNGARQYYFREGEFVGGKLDNGFYSNRYGTGSVVGGNGSGSNPNMIIYTQMELQEKYESLRALKPKKFPGAELTKEQHLFLDGKLSSEQILSIRKSQ